MRISSIGLIAAVSLGLGGCAYNGLGMGVGTGYGYDNGYGYDRYGYDRYGYGGYNPYGYNPYGYNPYGYGYGAPAGWYNGYYYPGTGGWVYDRDGRRREANFDGLGEAFRQAVKNRNNATTTTASSRTTATTTTAPVRAPTRTRVIERTERPRDTGARFLRVRRDKKED